MFHPPVIYALVSSIEKKYCIFHCIQLWCSSELYRHAQEKTLPQEGDAGTIRNWP